MGTDFILFLTALLVISVLFVLVHHGRKISRRERYTDPMRDEVYLDRPGSKRPRRRKTGAHSEL